MLKALQMSLNPQPKKITKVINLYNHALKHNRLIIKKQIYKKYQWIFLILNTKALLKLQNKQIKTILIKISR
jgi:hypothetical protein